MALTCVQMSVRMPQMVTVTMVVKVENTQSVTVAQTALTVGIALNHGLPAALPWRVAASRCHGVW